MNHLIVARWQEDISWLDTIDGWNPIVVTKNVDLPNEGRECSSFFFGLAKVYDSLRPGDRVACVQGSPLPHCPDLNVALLEEGPFVELGTWKVVCDLEGLPHHPGLPIREYWDDWIGTEPPESLSFTAGGQFSASAETILSRPVKDYQLMVGEMSRQSAPWVMERLWPYYWHQKTRK